MQKSAVTFIRRLPDSRNFLIAAGLAQVIAYLRGKSMNARRPWLTPTVRIGGTMSNDDPVPARWEHFQHSADIGIRGVGLTKQQAFEQAALALTATVTAPDKIRPQTSVRINIDCNSAGDEFLFLDWINALIFEMATRSMLFSRFQVVLDDMALSATAWGEPVDVARHCPAVEPKGATFTELAVRQTCDGIWIAQCVVDV